MPEQVDQEQDDGVHSGELCTRVRARQGRNQRP